MKKFAMHFISNVFLVCIILFVSQPVSSQPNNKTIPKNQLNINAVPKTTEATTAASVQNKMNCKPIRIITKLPDAKVNVFYERQIEVSGGVLPLSFELVSRPHQSELKLSQAGTLSGIILTSGKYNLTVRINDGCMPKQSVRETLELVVLGDVTKANNEGNKGSKTISRYPVLQGASPVNIDKNTKSEAVASEQMPFQQNESSATAILPIKIDVPYVPCVNYANYRDSIPLVAAISPNTSSSEAEVGMLRQIVRQKVHFFIDGNFIGDAVAIKIAGDTVSEKKGVAILPLKPHNTLQFNLQGGTHTLTAETNYDGKTVRGSGELVIGKSRAWFDDLSLTPKVPSVGETVTIQGALKSRHNVYVELGGFFGFLESTPPGYIPDSEMSHCERELRDFFGDLIPGDFFAFGDVYPVSNTDIEILLKGHKIYGGSEQELGKFRTRTNSQGRFALDFVLPANWFDDAMTFNSYYKVHMKLYLISKNYHEIDSVNFDDNSRPDIDFYVKP